MERILILGNSGSGKSTLARRMGEILAIPPTHIDRLHWRPGWTEAPEAEREGRLDAIMAGDRWIIDGNYSATLGARLRRCDTVVLLDVPRLVCLVRIVGRWAAYRGRTRPDMGEGCPEKVDWEFIRWVWTWPRRSRPRVLKLLEEAGSHVTVHRLRRPGEVEAFVASLATPCPRDGA